MDQSTGNGQEWSQVSERARKQAAERRGRSERLADQLSDECMQQVQRSVEGLLSIPTAVALGFASTTLYAAALFERGFEALQITSEALRSGIEQGRAELNRGEPDGPRLRSDAHA